MARARSQPAGAADYDWPDGPDRRAADAATGLRVDHPVRRGVVRAGADVSCLTSGSPPLSEIYIIFVLIS